MTRNDSAEPTPRRRQREPLSWPHAALGITALLVLGFVAWLCSGVATEWISR